MWHASHFSKHKNETIVSRAKQAEQNHKQRLEHEQEREVASVTSYSSEFLKQAFLVQKNYNKPMAGEIFSDIELQILKSKPAHIPIWLPKVFQHILDNFWSLDDLSRTDFLSCFLKLYRSLPTDKRNLRLNTLREGVDFLPSWDNELIEELFKFDVLRP